MSTPNLLSTAASYFMTTELAIGSVSFSKAYKAGKTILANHDSGDSDAYSASRKLIPPGYDTDLKALTKAQGALRTWFYSKTAPFGLSADGTQASGARLVAASLIADGSFMSEWNKLYADYESARYTFLASYPYTVTDIDRSGVLGSSFNALDYPDTQTLTEKLTAELRGPFPIADARALSGLTLSAAALDRIEAQMTAQVKRQLSFAQQDLATNLASYLETMATNLAKFADHANGRTTGTRAPAIYDSLTTNVADAVKKIRTYALPDTDAGSRLIAMADQIDQIIDPSALDADYLKSSPHLAGEIARNAASLAEALSGQEWAYN